MVIQIPAPLANIDVRRFALRASQLEQFKPVIAYWCDYFIVNKILEKGLHTESDECMAYTTSLMDKLERTKAEQPGNDAIHDDMAAQAYVEQFALETFQRAENVMKLNKVTAQTADTFTAAGTFLDLLGIWQKPIDQEIASKSKYAKFHALRIAKALKAGEDPNLSNPVPAIPEAAPPLDPNDPEVRRLQSLQPSVEDSSDHSRPASGYRKSPSNVTMTSPPPAADAYFSPPQDTLRDVSPIEPTQRDGGYFPEVSSQASNMPPTFTAAAQPSASAPVTTSSTSAVSSSMNPLDFYAASPPFPQPQASLHAPQPPPSPPRAPSHPEIPTSPTPPQFSHASPHAVFPAPQPQPPGRFQQPHYQSPQQTQAPPQPQSHPFQNPLADPQVTGAYRTDDEAIMAAQKHAKWAISALNFEDVPTAVKELTIALRSLGAR